MSGRIWRCSALTSTGWHHRIFILCKMQSRRPTVVWAIACCLAASLACTATAHSSSEGLLLKTTTGEDTSPNKYAIVCLRWSVHLVGWCLVNKKVSFDSISDQAAALPS